MFLGTWGNQINTKHTKALQTPYLVFMYEGFCVPMVKVFLSVIDSTRFFFIKSVIFIISDQSLSFTPFTLRQSLCILTLYKPPSPTMHQQCRKKRALFVTLLVHCSSHIVMPFEILTFAKIICYPTMYSNSMQQSKIITAKCNSISFVCKLVHSMTKTV